MRSPSDEELVDDIIEQLERCCNKPLPKGARGIVRQTINLGLNPPVEATAIRPHRIKVGDDGALRIIYDPLAPEYKPDARKRVSKRWAASQTFVLFYMISDTPPTNSPYESPFWLITQKLNEAVGGDPDDNDVTQACRAVLWDNKDKLQRRWGSRTLPTD
jgi:hypothetical protein